MSYTNKGIPANVVRAGHLATALHMARSDCWEAIILRTIEEAIAAEREEMPCGHPRACWGPLEGTITAALEFRRDPEKHGGCRACAREHQKAYMLREAGDRRDWEECDRIEGVTPPAPIRGGPAQ